MLGTGPSQTSCETFLGGEMSVFILFSKSTFTFYGKNTDEVEARLSFSLTVCLGKSEFSSFLRLKFYFQLLIGK